MQSSSSKRIEELERGLKRQRRLSFAALAAVTMALAMAMRSPTVTTLEAERFDLVDGDGGVLASWGRIASVGNRDVPAIQFYGPDGRPVCMIGSAGNGAFIDMNSYVDDAEEPAANYVRIDTDDDGTRMTMGWRGYDQINLRSDRTGPMLFLSNGSGNRIKLGSKPGFMKPNDGSIGLYIEDSSTDTRAQVQLSGGTTPEVVLFDSAGGETRSLR